MRGRCGGLAGRGVTLLCDERSEIAQLCRAQPVPAFAKRALAARAADGQSLPLRPAARKRREIAGHEARLRCGPALRAVAGAGLAPRRALDDAHGVLLAAFLMRSDRSSRRRAVTGQVAPTQPDCGKVTCGVESGHSR